MDRMTFAGKAVLVTGGATGIGRATSVAFAAEGARVMIGDIDPRAEETVAIIRLAGGEADFTPTDVTDPAAVDALVAACVSRYGRMDAAFNNAGVLPPQRPLHEVPPEEMAMAVDVDFKGVFYALQSEIRHFLKVGGGAIVNTASVGGLIADPNMAAYVAMKHAVIGLTKAAAVEYAQQGIRVNPDDPALGRQRRVSRRILCREHQRPRGAARGDRRHGAPSVQRCRKLRERGDVRDRRRPDGALRSSIDARRCHARAPLAVETGNRARSGAGCG
jgi:NAD(P)-dependent dehydrogenase (short-subunit alcohol dehydrogenase family)